MDLTNTRIVVFVHGWSVHHTKTYGEFPARLEQEALANAGLRLDIRHIWLSEYVSFHDEVRLDDISRAFEAAIRRELTAEINAGQKIVCITHSTGGPVARNWFDKYYARKNQIAQCPMSHLIMLAPANFGSALAQLGKSTLSRIKSAFEGVEPGQGVLDWLELGSPESWELNQRWIDTSTDILQPGTVFPFVITGQTIDRSLYDHINSYTGELGSDGVVRMCSANLNASYICLEQQAPIAPGTNELPLRVTCQRAAAPTAFAIAKGCAHTGKAKGIIESVKNDGRPHPAVLAVVECLQVDSITGYNALREKFNLQNEQVRQDELKEHEHEMFVIKRYFIHDPNSMVIFRVQDQEGSAIGNFNLVLTAGPQNDPNHLPPGFFIDRQKNSRHHGTLTYFLNYAVMQGCDAVMHPEDNVSLREKSAGAQALGLRIEPYINQGFVHYFTAALNATADQLKNIVRPDQTTMVDIKMRRMVHAGVFRLTRNRMPEEFKEVRPGGIING